MSVGAELVARLRARGATVQPDGNVLVIRPAAAVQPEEVPVLREHKAEILAALLCESERVARLAWPAVLPGLGARRVIPFAACADCEADPPADNVLQLGPYQLAVPRPRHTWMCYGDVALCRRHARVRAEAMR